MTESKTYKRYSQLAVIFVFLLLIVLFYVFDLKQYLTFETLKHHRQTLLTFVAAHWLLAVLLYTLTYIAIVALSLPGAAFMTITGGFLFGLWTGTLSVVIAATIGATIVFILARFVLADIAREKAAPWLRKLEKEFQEDAFNYLLVLRLIPLFPFFVVNLVPAVLGVSLRTYVLATFMGIIPGTFVYVSIGTGLGSILDRSDTFTLTGILTPQILLALGGLAVLALLPVVYKKWKKR